MSSATRTRDEQSGRKRVLVVALSFPPSAAPAAIPAAQMARFLPRHGWFATFLTIRPEHLLMPHAAADAYPLPRRGIAVHRTSMVYPWDALASLAWWRRRRKGGELSASDAVRPASMSHGRARRSPLALLESILKFPDVQCGWLPFAILGGLAVARRRRVDCLYSIGPPWTAHVAALIIHHLLRIPWIADFHDPWTANPWRGITRPWPLGPLEAKLERSVLRSADMVVTKTPEITAMLRQRSQRHDEQGFATIPCAYDKEEIDAARQLAEKRADTFVLTHAGRFYGPRSPVPLLTAVACLAEIPELARRLELRLVGEHDARVQALADRLGIAPLLRQVGLASHLHTLRHILESDLAVVVQPATGVQIPSKVYEYLGCGVPILALTGDGATARLIRQARAGVVVASDDVEGIAAAIRAFCTGEMPAASVRPDSEVVRQFEASAVIGRVAGMLDSVSNRSRSGRR